MHFTNWIIIVIIIMKTLYTQQCSIYERGRYDCSTKHAYLVFPDKQSADAVVEQANAYPVEFNDRMLIVRHYTEPPNHVPKGLFLSAFIRAVKLTR